MPYNPNSAKNLLPAWKPGQTGNSNGRPGLKTAFRKVSRDWVNELAHMVFERPHHEFQDWLVDHCRSPAEMLVGTAVRKIATTGDIFAVKALFDVLIGEPPKLVPVVEIQSDKAPGLDSLTREELEKRRAVLAQAAKKAEHE